jgi:hypothetical protein
VSQITGTTIANMASVDEMILLRVIGNLQKNAKSVDLRGGGM